MEAIHKLRIECPYTILSIEDIKIECKPNNHGKLSMKCLIDDSINFKYSIEALTEDKIIIYEEVEDSGESIIFNGIIENVRTTNENGIYYLELEGASSSCILDLEEKTRSFQDKEMSYDDLIDEILKDYKGFGFAQCMNKPMKIGRPLYQYKESDYEFLKRVASHLGLELICDLINYSNLFYFGTPVGKKYELEGNINYKAFKDLERYHKDKNLNTNFNDTDFFYYEVKTREKYEIGDKIHFKEKDLYVNQYEAELYCGELLYKYRFCRRGGIWQSRIYNEKLRGASLEGEVLQTSGEKVKLHLYVDESQDPSKAEWFHYAPATGNIMYSMPIVGETATLYFQDEVDSKPIVTGCVRKNGSTCENFSDTANRYFATESGNNLDMLPGAISFHRSGLNVNFNDNSGVTLNSSGNLNIGAAGNVTISGESVSIKATSKLMVQKEGTSYMSVENEFYVESSVVYENGSSRESYAAFTDDDPVAGVTEAKKKLGDKLGEKQKVGAFKGQQLIDAMEASQAKAKDSNSSTVSDKAENSKSTSKVKTLDTEEEGYDYGRIEHDDGMGMKTATFYGKHEFFTATIAGREYGMEHDLRISETEIKKNEKAAYELNFVEFETGINKIEFDNDMGGINSVKAEAAAKVGKEGAALEAKFSFMEIETPKKKIPLPFCDKAIEVGASFDLGSLGGGFKLGYGHGLTWGAHCGVGAEFTFDIKNK